MDSSRDIPTTRTRNRVTKCRKFIWFLHRRQYRERWRFALPGRNCRDRRTGGRPANGCPSVGDLLKCLLKLRDKGCLALLQLTTSHHPPQVSLRGRAAVIDSQHIFGWPRFNGNDHVRVFRTVHQREFAPFLDGVLYPADGGAIVGQQAWIVLVAVVGGYIHVTGVGQNPRHRGSTLGG